MRTNAKSFATQLSKVNFVLRRQKKRLTDSILLSRQDEDVIIYWVEINNIYDIQNEEQQQHYNDETSIATQAHKHDRVSDDKEGEEEKSNSGK